MDRAATAENPVLRYLAVARAARDFGLDPDTLDALALRYEPVPGSVDAFAEAVADALLARDS
jgi:hypothetical protein